MFPSTRRPTRLPVLWAVLATAVAAAAGREAGTPVHPLVDAMADNTWLKLPVPKVHPITRSSSPWMPYVPRAGVGILWGASHCGYTNDLWTYDLSRNLWKEMLPAEPSAAADPAVLKHKDGLIMTRQERPLAGHQWGFMDYDADRKVLWKLPGLGNQGIWVSDDPKLKLGFKMKDVKEARARLAAAGKNGPTLWKYDLAANKWSWVHTQDPTRCTRHGGYIRYFPPLRKLVMTPKWVSPNEDRRSFKLYDPDTNRWEPLKITWKPLAGDQKVSPYWVYGHSPIVYDAQRKVLVLILSKGGTWLLDPIAKTMTQAVAKDRSLPGNLDGPVGAFVYDSVNAVTLAIFADYKTYGAGKQLQARGLPADVAHVWALDVEKNAWALQPRPADGVLPPADQGHMVHHFYDPVHNAAVIYKGGYNSPRTQIWVYRYRRRKAG